MAHRRRMVKPEPEDYEPTVEEEAGATLDAEWQWAIVDIHRMLGEAK
jgi:hypothetical protein